MTRQLPKALLLLLVLGGCGDEVPPPPPGGGGSLDAGREAGSDGGPLRDAEAGAPDAGPGDASPPPDGSPDDGGPVDAGRDGSLDAGPPEDATVVPLDGGCEEPACDPAPPGCRYERAPDDCGCGALRCECGGTWCAADQVCVYDVVDGCGGAGSCVARPADCLDAPLEPVCGCDGATYANECDAHRLGVSVASTGSCEGEVGSDCRMDGCPPGWVCMACGDRHECVDPVLGCEPDTGPDGGT